MSVETEIARIKNAVTTAYAACAAKGVNVPSGYQPIDDLPAAINQASSLFGLKVSDFIIDNNGTLQTTVPESWNNTEITNIGSSVFSRRWTASVAPTEIILPNLVQLSQNAFYYACQNATGIKKFILPNCSVVASQALMRAFEGSTIEEFELGVTTAAGSILNYCCLNCSNLQSVKLTKLQSVTGLSLTQAFLGTAVKNVSFDALTQVTYNNAFNKTFSNCSQLVHIYFPALTSFGTATNPFGATTNNFMCQGSTNATIHFRADMQATVSQLTGFDSKWGAKAVVFDL